MGKPLAAVALTVGSAIGGAAAVLAQPSATDVCYQEFNSGSDSQAVHSSLSPYMNSIPPSEDYFCVGNGPGNRALHPDRAPYTRLAEQDGVILFSGTAPQQGFNFQLAAGDLIYRNQMSTLGVAEPPPQVGAAGLLKQRAWDFVMPWSEARWHPGEDITWQGFRRSAGWLEGAQEWDYVTGECNATGGDYGPENPEGPGVPEFYKPCIYQGINGSAWRLRSSISLQLARGMYQLSKVRPEFSGMFWEAPYEFREPWFHGRGRSPIFNMEMDTSATNADYLENRWRLAERYFPNYLNIYPYSELEVDGGRLRIAFERSATWPREPSEAAGRGEVAGTVVAETIRDEYGNLVHFDRVPRYGWETDYKIPSKPSNIMMDDDPNFGTNSDYPGFYDPKPQAWRLPHKRLRTVRLIPADRFDATESDNGDATWTIAFVYEHPESDRIAVHDTPPPMEEGQSYVKEWKSLYSHLPQAEWDAGRLPELNDETTLLTVQVYKGNEEINGARFQDDYSVWGNTIGTDDALSKRRVNKGAEYPGDRNGDGCPGICGIDDDGDGLIDEDSTGNIGGEGYTCRLAPCYNVEGTTCAAAVCSNDDNEDGVVESQVWGNFWHGISSGTANSLPVTDGPGDADFDSTGPNCPGACGLDEDGDEVTDETSDGLIPGAEYSQWDPFYVFDDDEDGIYDEDGPHDPLLVYLRALDGECASGVHPYVPASDYEQIGAHERAQLPGASFEDHCRPVNDAAGDPWVYQVQYVYARSNPYWLLSAREPQDDPEQADFGRIRYLKKPQYYYFPPFPRNFAGDNPDTKLFEGAANTTTDDVLQNDLEGEGTGDWSGFIVDSSAEGFGDGLPNVHPDCVPDRDFRGPQGFRCATHAAEASKVSVPATGPSDIHLIKRIVRARPDVIRPTEYVEQTWLYRYNDMGFLKAVFDPAAVQALIDAAANDEIEKPDDILKFADTHAVVSEGATKPLIFYASHWYTYYNPYVPADDGDGNEIGIQPCYDEAPYTGRCAAGLEPDDSDPLDLAGPLTHRALNVCDGQVPWQDGYGKEMHVDPDCSEFFARNCGECTFRGACETAQGNCSGTPACTCGEPEEFAQLGITGAQSRLRKYMIKTARVRGADGAMHTYRLDYLGAANSVYSQGGHITSYADAHNITIVDELVEQTRCEFAPQSAGCPPEDQTNNFYIYEPDFRFVLDSSPTRMGEENYATYHDDDEYLATSHYLYVPVKVKTRRVVTMNYYGIAISDRLILTPGFAGTQTALVDDQQYELTNKRGQTVQLYDPSWVAQLRANDFNLHSVKQVGRVLVELFGGQDGWHSVLRGIAKGSKGGHLYDQQCKTPEVVPDVPVQRVTDDQLSVVSATKHFQRDPDGAGPLGIIRDLPEVEAGYARPTTYGDWAEGSDINDPADMVADAAPNGTGCNENDHAGARLENQEPVEISDLFGEEGSTDDGASAVRYDYFFHGGTSEDRVKWKWRWQEAVPIAQGGSGHTAMEVWFFDKAGRVRIYGLGRGEGDGGTRPTPAVPFTVTYYGYDAFSRLAIEVVNVDPVDIAGGSAELLAEDLGGEDMQGLPTACASGECRFVTRYKYDDIGTLVSKCEGLANLGTYGFDLNAGGGKVRRTDYAVIANRAIRHLEDGHRQTTWTDPYTYQVEYQYASGEGDEAVADGITTVNMFDRGGRFIEQRVIARADSGGSGQVRDFGWAISLADYESDESPNSWDFHVLDGRLDTGSLPLFENTDCPGPACSSGEPIFNGSLNLTPAHGGGDWPPSEDRIVTLARSFQRYTQASTLKPTEQVVFRDFGAAAGTEDRREVARKFTYDLEDRIARQKEPDGTITRFLFDSKRRPTKVFKGSSDSHSSWFPPAPDNAGEDDTMALLEQRLYNDGTAGCEHSSAIDDGDGDPGNDCTTASTNPNFPWNAGKLVRVRRFSGDAEPSNDAYDPEASSRDTQYVYDWRGRPVIAREVAVGYEGGTAANPTFVTATTTIFDNLDRPLVVATWASNGEPDVATIEGWQDAFNQETTIQDILELPQPPLTLSQALYDERGRPYEQRTYDVGYPDGQTFTFTRTYRDDLDRVVAEWSADGCTVHTYDPLGRVTSTSHWSACRTQEPAGGADVELTRTLTSYDAFGNVLAQTYFDRKSLTGASGALNSTDAIRTYTCNWYDKAKRLAATANFGTNHSDGFTSGNAPPCVNDGTTSPPTWGCSGATCVYTIASANPTDLPPIVNRYGYDRAGRRIWSQNPQGIVTRTWYDLLGHTLLVAENWKDNENLDCDSAGANCATLTPLAAGQSHGPIRYTAYHYTRGGLLDMIVAILPTDTGVFQLTPDDIDWAGETADNDFSATGIESIDEGSPSYQATRFVYGAVVVSDTDHTAQGEISRAPNLVAEIRYPGDGGAADETDRVQLKFTLDGHLAQRTDQRGVTLDYTYGKWGKLRSLDADIPGVAATAGVDTETAGKFFAYDDEGRLMYARTDGNYGPNSENWFDYDLFGNLKSDVQVPATLDNRYTRAVSYLWNWTAPDAEGRPRTSRLADIAVLPYGVSQGTALVKFAYGQIAESPEDDINRMTAVTDAGESNFLRYEMTGGGRVKQRTWGPDGTTTIRLRVDAVGTSIAPRTDTFGRTTRLAFDRSLPGTTSWAGTNHSYEHGYDSGGNRLYDRASQVGYSNFHSYLYRYDRLNRLAFAERGKLNDTSPPNSYIASANGHGRSWTLDVLGNWSGADAGTGSVIDYVPNATAGLDSDSQTRREHHVVGSDNSLDARSFDPDGSGTQPTATTTFEYDAAGNLTNDGVYVYYYDAFGRLVRVKCAAADNGTVAGYEYDALDRRIRKWVGSGGACGVPTEVAGAGGQGDVFYYDGHRVIEHHRSLVAGTPTPGDYLVDSCSTATQPPPPPPSEKRISDAAAPVEDAAAQLVKDVVAAGSQVASTFAGGEASALTKGGSRPRDDVWDRFREFRKQVERSEPRPSGSGLFSQARGAEGGDEGTGKQVETHLSVGGGTAEPEPRLVKQFVYGLQYIDELVAQVVPSQMPGGGDPALRYVLQDVNYNVVGIARACDGKIVRQFRYTPYGEITAEGITYNGNGTVNQITPLTASSYFETLHGFQGHLLDRETGNVNMRGREYFPPLGRFGQRDPNETGLLVATAMLYNAQTPKAFAGYSARGQFGDGASLYLAFGANPVNRTDPMGLFSRFDWMGESEELESDITGHRLYALGAINEGARWASLGLQTALDIGGSLLGVDLFQSVAVIASGRGGFWDSMNIFLSVAPFGYLGKVGLKLGTDIGRAGAKVGKGFGYLRKSSRAIDIAGEAAEHLFKILPYRQARKLTAGWGGRIKAHHILEKRHAERWGGIDVDEIPAVILTHQQHVDITNALQRRLSTGVRHDKRKVWAAYKAIYTDFGYSEWLEYIEKYFP